ncbi:transposable element Tc1 transposase [Trichonephila clavipes]|nr:transposable element Tc1 transposase [Trichonephila clavipes]
MRLKTMRSLEDAGKNGWTVADFSVIMVAINLGSQQIGRTMPIVSTHCQARLQWCLAQSGWNRANKERIMFSNKFRYHLCPDDHRRRVWRRPGQRANPAFTIARHTGPQPRVMVWAAFSDSRSPFAVIRDTLTAQKYVDDTLRTVFLPFLLQYLVLIFQARQHAARVAMNYRTACQNFLGQSDRQISLQ